MCLDAYIDLMWMSVLVYLREKWMSLISMQASFPDPYFLDIVPGQLI